MRKTFIACFCLLFALDAMSQDLIFSNFNQAPLSLNPALAGHFEGNYRVGAMYRNQWAGIGKSAVYSSPSAYADFNFLDEKLRGSMGGGINVMSEESVAGGYGNLTANIALAYHLALDKEEQKNFVSFGVNGGIINQRANANQLLYASQFDGEKLSSSVANGEGFDNTNSITPDVSVGAVWASYFNGGNIRAGAAYKHLLPQTASFYKNGGTYNMPSALIAHLEGNFMMGKTLSLHPNLLYAAQANTTNINGNLQLGFHFSNQNALYIGGGVRANDAIVAIMRLQLGTANIGVAYDINNSALAPATRGQGAWELALNFTGGSGRKAIKGSNNPIVPPVRYY
jgi:type IX secretion system PorP/SprF family membrane protein